MPRPILKPLATARAVGSSTSSLAFPTQTESPHVHFPPTPAISSTYAAHSPNTYDRAPIVVSPNSCELPERGERVYTSTSPNTVSPKGSYFHPHAYEACQPEPELPPSMLAVPDLSMSASSESEDSDGYGSPQIVPPPIPPNTTYPPIPRTCSPEEFNHVLSFLPHRKDSMCSLDSETRRARRAKTSEANRSARSATSSAFSEPGLDGCLGGF
ncbi:uncharacterized protein EV420DRAFT_1261161 [Desarmillaria tabescens]|uniref:Uncharacterized protein n=1 Tax=Armillaria tabescens TaxID=1929756 RepID=A0AA39NHZ6_ARMTA|nr:uncharacterized protein EV420DRAFT_1261161 [Desarmillaria tabescens]KAK0465977.1 hypothetical protein EV420DRAFT_1261161 [Desarmillaria tabescens]